MRKLFLAAAGLLVLGTLPAAAADSDICIRRNDIREWASPASKQLVLENYARRKVLLRMSGSCDGFGVYDTVQISGPLESSASCVSAGDTIRTLHAGAPGLCSVLSVAAYDGPMPPKRSR
ncbi:MAG TPA: hypothetical protein VGC36_13970 [Rhizomicrobium sp.]